MSVFERRQRENLNDNVAIAAIRLNGFPVISEATSNILRERNYRFN